MGNEPMLIHLSSEKRTIKSRLLLFFKQIFIVCGIKLGVAISKEFPV